MTKQNEMTVDQAWAVIVGSLVNPVVSVKSPNGHIVQCDLRKVPANVGALFAPGFVEKRLSDISKNSTKGGTENDVHEQRRKVVETWYAGDLTMRGGGTADPVAVQMKEEIVAAYIAAGAAPAEARKFVKGTAMQFLQAMAEKQPEAEREAWLKAKVEHYRTKAEATLKTRQKEGAKVDISTLSI